MLCPPPGGVLHGVLVAQDTSVLSIPSGDGRNDTGTFVITMGHKSCLSLVWAPLAGFT